MAVTSKVQENTGYATRQHGNSTLSNWHTCKSMCSFAHWYKYVYKPKIWTVKHIVNILY